MRGIEQVEVIGYRRLRWTGRVCGSVVSWEVEVVDHIQDTRLRWRACDGRETGDVDFQKVDAGSSLVHYQLEYEPELWGVDEEALHGCLLGTRARTTSRSSRLWPILSSERQSRGERWGSASESRSRTTAAPGDARRRRGRGRGPAGGCCWRSSSSAGARAPGARPAGPSPRESCTRRRATCAGSTSGGRRRLPRRALRGAACRRAALAAAAPAGCLAGQSASAGSPTGRPARRGPRRWPRCPPRRTRTAST